MGSSWHTLHKLVRVRQDLPWFKQPWHVQGQEKELLMTVDIKGEWQCNLSTLGNDLGRALDHPLTANGSALLRSMIQVTSLQPDQDSGSCLVGTIWYTAKTPRRCGLFQAQALLGGSPPGREFARCSSIAICICSGGASRQKLHQVRKLVQASNEGQMGSAGCMRIAITCRALMPRPHAV